MIFLNTAHVPLAVASTFGQELGHYPYGSMVSEHLQMSAMVEGTTVRHLGDQSELFAESLVWQAAYDLGLIQEIPGTKRGDLVLGFGQFKHELGLTSQRYGVRLVSSGRHGIRGLYRVRYLTSMIHFFKLRAALLATAGA